MQENASLQNKPKKIYLIIFVALSIAILIFVLLPLRKAYLANHLDINGIYLIHPMEIDDVDLITTNNQHFTKKDLYNHWTLMYFGFTRCQMACPTTLSSLNEMYNTLSKKYPRIELPQVIFLTIDPARDALEDLKKYVTSFNPHFIGARSTKVNSNQEAEKTFNLSVKKIESKSDNKQYSYEHSLSIVLINPKAQIQAFFNPLPPAEKLVTDYVLILNKYMNSQPKNL